jgi:hypothetical protein
MWRDFLCFRRMLLPWLIQICFWVGIILCILAGINTLYHEHAVLKALKSLIFGPIALRVICEFLILFFRMNETLTDINQKIASRSII